MVGPRFPTYQDFPKEGVSVNFPGQGSPIQVLRLALPVPIPPGSAGVFVPFRLVINLKLVDARNPEIKVSDYKPNIEVNVRITKSDVATAKNLDKPLCLGFWDGTQWIRITDVDHGYHTHPDSLPDNGGMAIFRISHWGDPTIAVGT